MPLSKGSELRRAEAAHHTIEVGDVRQHVICMNDVSALAVRQEPFGELRSKVFTDRRYAPFHVYTRNIAGGFDTQPRDAGSFRETELFAKQYLGRNRLRDLTSVISLGHAENRDTTRSSGAGRRPA